MASWVVVLLVFVLAGRCAHADDFSDGVEAYDEGDYETALALWQSLASQGDPRAQYRLAQMFAAGIGVRKDVPVALRWLRQAAEQGSVEARYDLALRYSRGRGVRKDDAQAASWYGSLAEDGHATAQYLLARMYEQGKGVGEDASRAAYWYRRAAELGYLEAQAKLGVMYLEGQGVPRDPAQAWAWFDLAAARGHDAAAGERTKLRLRLNEDELAQALELSRELNPLLLAQPTGRETGIPSGTETAAEVETAPEPATAPEMIRIRSGCFAMGSDPAEAGRHDSEIRHYACVESFSIARYETTRGQYAAFVDATGREMPDGCQVYEGSSWEFRTRRSWRSPGFVQGDDHPVVCVSRNDAIGYAKWLSERIGRNYRLPTEAEWEYAARAGAGAPRAWGNDPGDACIWANVGDHSLYRHFPEWPWTIHACEDGYAHTAPIGSFRANRHGVHDMAGNVWEWTCSSYDAAYRGAEHRCATGARSGVVRGGSWSNSPRWVRSAARFESRVNAQFDLVGFRLAHD